jgi:uncharacterized small protein (DUF1192 family)
MDAKDRVAVQTPAHLKRWLSASGRKYLIFKTDDLIDALPWPAGVETLMQIVREYDLQRQQIDSGQTELMLTDAGEAVVAVSKTQLLERDEINECIEQLQTEYAQRSAEAQRRAATHAAGTQQKA